MDEAGPLIRSFPRVVSLTNWKFVVVLITVVALAAAPSLISGEWQSALIAAGGILSVVLVYLLAIAGAEASGLRTLHALHEHGFVWRSGSTRTFVKWSEVVSVTHRPGQHPTWEVVLRDGKPKPVIIDTATGGADSARFIEQRVVPSP